MSAFKVETLPGEPIMVSTLFETWSVSNDLSATVDQLVAHLDAADGPLYYISRFSGLRLTLQDLIVAANQAARGSSALLHHPNLRKLLLVTDLKLFELAARGLDSEVFGNVPVSVFQTFEEALEYARNGS
jgi:hypothetical protein